MQVAVIGTGYVGLVSGVCLAEKGHSVICVDIDAEKVDKINNAIPPIYERGLETLLKKNAGTNLEAITDLKKAILESDISLIAVGTPFDGNSIDLTYIEEVARQIGEALKEKTDYHVVVTKSTVVPGTTEETVLPLLEEYSGKKAGRDFGVGMNPEFLREGEAVDDFMFPDRIVLGGIDDKTRNVMAELYSPFEGVDIVRTTPKTAELIKYTANSLLATMISFSNEIGNLCTALGGIDVVDVMRGVHLDKRLTPIMEGGERINPSFTTYIEAGCGFGGSCFPKDVKALVAHGKKAGLAMRLLDSVIQTNDVQPQKIIEIMKKHYPSINGVKVAILGLAFKPGTDDMRESPAIPIIKGLIDENAVIKAYDPVAKEEAMKLFNNGKIDFCDDLSLTVEGAEVVALLTRWDEFNILPELLKNMDPQPLLIDGRRMLNKDDITRYDGIGL